VGGDPQVGVILGHSYITHVVRVCVQEVGWNSDSVPYRVSCGKLAYARIYVLSNNTAVVTVLVARARTRKEPVEFAKLSDANCETCV